MCCRRPRTDDVAVRATWPPRYDHRAMTTEPLFIPHLEDVARTEDGRAWLDRLPALVGDLLAELHRAPVPETTDLYPLTKIMNAWADQAERRMERLRPDLDPGLVALGLRTLRELPDSSARKVILHGDFNPGNRPGEFPQGAIPDASGLASSLSTSTSMMPRSWRSRCGPTSQANDTSAAGRSRGHGTEQPPPPGIRSPFHVSTYSPTWTSETASPRRLVPMRR